MRKIIIVLMLSAMLTSCVPKQEDEQESTSTMEKTISEPATVDLSKMPTAEREENDTPVVIPAPGQRSSEAKLVHLVSLDLSKRLEIDISEVNLIESNPVTWKDASLGCPTPEKIYTQETRSGFQIILEAQNVKYTYHSDGLDHFFWCNENIIVPPLDETKDPFR